MSQIAEVDDGSARGALDSMHRIALIARYDLSKRQAAMPVGADRTEVAGWIDRIDALLADLRVALGR